LLDTLKTKINYKAWQKEELRLSKEEKVGDDYFCPTCGKSYAQGGRCFPCGEILETIEASKENDNIDDELLGVIHNIPAVQEAGGGKAGINIEDDY